MYIGIERVTVCICSFLLIVLVMFQRGENQMYLFQCLYNKIFSQKDILRPLKGCTAHAHRLWVMAAGIAVGLGSKHCVKSLVF